jgi:hypothetical protein
VSGRGSGCKKLSLHPRARRRARSQRGLDGAFCIKIQEEI